MAAQETSAVAEFVGTDNDRDEKAEGEFVEVSSEEKEEKLKVVVRVRPLQKGESPWPSTQSTRPDSELSDAGTRSRWLPGGVLAKPAPTTSEPSSLQIHDNSVTWEKNGQVKMLLADAAFDGKASQEQVYRSVQDCIDGLVAGYDCSVFAYGQTGTGKTHTMSGLPPSGSALDFDNDNDGDLSTDSLGVVPRCVQKLFEMIEQQRASEGPSVSFSVYCSFVEIYNEKIYDILSADPAVMSGASPTRPTPRHLNNRAGWNRPQPVKETPSLQIRQKLDGTVFVDGLTSRNVSSRSEMLRAFREGSMNREVRDNLYNQHSSRGHSIFQVTLRKNVATERDGLSRPKKPQSITPREGGTKTRLSRLYFVDLAGSEKWHLHGSELSDKYASELSSINKSLSALTNCVLALTQKERMHVPYRDSVLTRLLQSCLQGQGRTSFIVTISPARESLEESFATLRFAERLKALRCRPVRRKVFANELIMGEQRVYYEKQIHSMRLEVTRLRELLKKAQRRNQEIVEATANAANAALMEENRRLKELLMHSERNRLVERSERITGKPNSKALSTVEASPQQLAAKHILSSPRPASEEETSPKDSGLSVSNTARDRRDTTTPQPRREVLNADRPGHTNSGVETSADEKEYSSLVNKLQDKEARLNWMLEAEMEVQNTTKKSAGVAPPEKPLVAAPKSTVTRSWAVERVLRRNLVAVPAPLRSAADSTSDMTSSTVSSGRTLVPPVPSQPSARVATDMNTPTRIRQGNATVAFETGKEDSPRRPVPTQVASANDAAPTTSRPTQPSTSKTAPVTRHPPSTVASSSTIEPHVKSASILKLVGSANAEKMGRSKDELVGEYKRARRAELEAMLRTMVQR